MEMFISLSYPGCLSHFVEKQWRGVNTLLFIHNGYAGIFLKLTSSALPELWCFIARSAWRRSASAPGAWKAWGKKTRSGKGRLTLPCSPSKSWRWSSLKPQPELRKVNRDAEHFLSSWENAELYLCRHLSISFSCLHDTNCFEVISCIKSSWSNF